MIRLTLTNNITFNIINKMTTVNLMKVLSNMYKKTSISNNIHLMWHLFNLKMNEGMSVADYINKSIVITN